jgi:hypothetical protein
MSLRGNRWISGRAYFGLETHPRTPPTRNSEHLPTRAEALLTARELGGKEGACEHAWYLDALVGRVSDLLQIVDSDILVSHRNTRSFCCKGFSRAENPEDFRLPKPNRGACEEASLLRIMADGLSRGFEPRRLQKKALFFCTVLLPNIDAVLTIAF